MIHARIGYWSVVALAATLTLSLGAALVPRALDARLATRAERITATARPGSAQLKRYNSLHGRAVLAVRDVKPGEMGKRRLIITNPGPAALRKVLLTQDQVDRGGMSSALQLQVFDASARRCLYPRPPARQRVPRAKAEPKRCARWMPFDGGRELRNVIIPGAQGKPVWKRGERHVIDVRWRLDPGSPNTDQGRRASFRFQWRLQG